MDKSNFVKKAPIIYAIAICHLLYQGSSRTSLEDIRDHYSGHDDGGPFEQLGNETIMEAALQWLARRNIIEIDEDDFGPSTIVAASEFNALYLDLRNSPGTSFYNFGRAQNTERWLHVALQSVASRAIELAISPSDFALDADQDLWAPIPLDKESAAYQGAVSTIEEVLEQVRGSNGYSESNEEEKTYVISGLSIFLERIKIASSTSKPFINNYGYRPLKIIVQRFGNALVGVAAQGAIAALRAWLGF